MSSKEKIMNCPATCPKIFCAMRNTRNQLEWPYMHAHTPAIKTHPQIQKSNFHIIWETQKLVTADCMKPRIAKVALPSSSNIDI